MHIVGSQIHKEWLLLVFLHKADGVGNYTVGYILVFPERLSPTLHIANTTNTVHNALIVPVAGFQVIEQLGILLTGRFAFEVLLITDQNGSRWVVVGHMALFNEDAGSAVGRSSHDIMIVETYITRMHGKLGIPILLGIPIA